MAKITIDGRTFAGNSVSIINGVVTVDGVQQDGTLTGEVRLKIEGTLDSLTTDASVDMTGRINGNVEAGGSVRCDDVGGSINAGGSIRCDDVGGSINAGGSVKHR